MKNKSRLRKGEKTQIDWDKLVSDLLENCYKYHEYFYKYNIFTGPSLYFHERALSLSGKKKSEMTYATLASWGMHRMGSSGAKMKKYECFEKSIFEAQVYIRNLKNLKLESLTETDSYIFEKIINTLDPMETKPKVVAVSKVLAHYLPEIIAPIDNEYTFQFICQKPGQTNPPRNWNEIELFMEIHLRLYKKVILHKKFINYAKKWINNPSYAWDTSFPKIVDNLIIGKIKHLKETDSRYKKNKKNSNKPI